MGADFLFPLPYILELCCHSMMCKKSCVRNNLAFLQIVKELECLSDIIENLVLYLSIEKHLYNKHNQTTSFVSFIRKVFVISLQYYYTISILQCQAFFKIFWFLLFAQKKFLFLAILHKLHNTLSLKRFRNFGSKYFHTLKCYHFNFLLLYHFKACFRWQNKRFRKHLFCYSDRKKRELSFSSFSFGLFVIVLVMCIEIMCPVFK